MYQKEVLMNIKIKRALVSVSDKTNIIDFCRKLEALGVDIISTGGTAKTLKENGVNITQIDDYTGFPEIMDGRVKTLHPKVHGGLLAVRDDESHIKQMQDNNIEAIDMVVVNLYPFEATVAKGADYAEVIENIDIGGPSMVRSAAKNHKFVTIVTTPDDYNTILQELSVNDGFISFSTRQKLAAKAFSKTAQYDSAISNWFSSELSDKEILITENLSISAKLKQKLRYGENPHQQAGLYISDANAISPANAKIIQGKELSYNNLLDADSAFALVNEFDDIACTIVKHNNPCGVAISHKSQKDAYIKALGCDNVSAFGGIFAFNRKLEAETAEEINKLFAEVIIAPEYSDEALEIFAKKKNLRVLETGYVKDSTKETQKQLDVKSISGGYLIQDKNSKIFADDNLELLKVVTKRKPTEQELQDLKFAFTVCKHVKSNAIIYAKDGSTVGIGAGQMSRIDSSKIGADKAKNTNINTESAKGSVLASDAFFPFADGLEAAAAEGITAVIQPGGSIRDDEVIAAADNNNIAMLFTEIRHFRH